MIARSWLAALLLVAIGPAVALTEAGSSHRANGRIVADGGSPGGSASSRNGLLVSVKPAGGGARRRAFPLGLVARSPSGDHLAIATKNGLLLYDGAGRGRRRIAAASRINPRGSVAFSPDGGRVVFEGPVARARLGARFYTVRIDGNDLRPVAGPRGYMPKWSPDGRTITFIRPSPKGIIESWGDIGSVPAAGGKQRLLYRPPSKNEGIASFDWSPDGRQLVLDVQDNGPGCEGIPPGVPCYQPPTNELGMTIISRRGQLVRRFGRDGYNPIWSPDGRRIAFMGHDGLTTPILTISSQGGAAHRVMSFPSDYVASIAWLPRR